MKAAVAAVRQQGAREVVVAVPVAAISSCEEFRSLADEVICAHTPNPFFAVGGWYDDFSQTTDAEVSDLLESAAKRFEAAPQN